MKSDFTSMAISELRAYVLQHRHDREAFYVLMDRSNGSSSESYPCPNTPENLQIMKQAIRQHLAASQQP
jgi:hypothetical protein